MRELLNDVAAQDSLDPNERARRNLRAAARERFYRHASAGEADEEGRFPVLLDGRGVRTPARRVLAAPTRALAEALAAEWESQREAVDPARMPLTRLANTIIDGVADKPAEVARDIANYLGSDLLVYRADNPAGLAAEQEARWDPVLAWARVELGAEFVLASGVVHVPQPEAALAAARAALPADAWRLGALHSVTTLTGSALLALALAAGRLGIAEAWQAAHVDEDWNMRQWGRDEEALARRDRRFAEMQAAARVLELVNTSAAPSGFR